MKVMEMKFEDFKRYMADVQHLVDLQDNIEKAGGLFFASGGCDGFYFDYPTGIRTIVELLELMTNDTDNLIYSWVFELHCGKYVAEIPHTDNPIYKDTIAKIIPMKTIEHLWEALNRNNVIKGKGQIPPKICYSLIGNEYVATEYKTP